MKKMNIQDVQNNKRVKNNMLMELQKERKDSKTQRCLYIQRKNGQDFL